MVTQPLLLVGALLLVGGVLLSKTSSRFGVPSLLLFLVMGMVAGSEGLIGIEFDDIEAAQSFGVVALAFILFSGGLSTRWSDIRPVMGAGIALASVGVLLSAVVLGLIATLVLSLPVLEGLLLAAIIASTDAAAVFAILRSRGVQLKGRLGPLLELESGSNDPAAVFLTVGLIGLIEATGRTVPELVGLFVLQMGLGASLGWLIARLAVRLINRLRLEYEGLYPVLTFAFVLVVYEGVNLVGGSGFLAAYVAGLTMANAEFLHRRSLIRFHDAISWLMQIAMFVLLGLLIFPSELGPVAWRGLVVAAVLMFLARPLAVAVTLLPFRMPWREVTFVSWVGLRGATPVILATFPVVSGVPDADRIFNAVFFVVLASVAVQGTTIPFVARWLGVGSAPTGARTSSFDAVISGDTGHHLHELVVPPGSPVAGHTLVELGLPPGLLVVLLRRGNATLMPQGGTEIAEGDELLVLGEPELVDAMQQRLRPG